MTDKSYTIRATGLSCKKESDWDQGSSSDEYYSIVNILGARTDGTWKSSTVKVPKGGAFSDVDSGEFRKMDVVVWDGPLCRFAINAQLMEEDEGDGSDVAELIEAAAQAAIIAGEAESGVNVPDEFADALAAAIPKLFGLGDDRVDVTQSRYFSTKRLPSLVASKAQKTHGAVYRFRTWHAGGGAQVVVHYDIAES